MSVSADIVAIRRVAIGIVTRDLLSERALVYPVRIDRETIIPHASALVSRREFNHNQSHNRPPGGFARHWSGRYSLHYHDKIGDAVNIRIYDLARRYVPRRLRVPVVPLGDVLVREANEVPDYLSGRIRYPVLFPGAAYPLSRVTGLRGRVVRGTTAERWAVLEARSLTNGGAVVARARADDRGEFLLLVPPQAVPASDLSQTFQLAIAVFAPTMPAVPANPEVPAQDPYWNVPLETIVDPAATDAVSAGSSVPAGFVESPTVTNVTFHLDRLLTGRDVGDVVFTPP